MDQYLVKIGAFFGLVGETVDRLRALVYLFQRINSIKDDGVIGPVTRRAIQAWENMRICANVEPLMVNRWGFKEKHVGVRLLEGLPGHESTILDNLVAATAEIMNTCGVVLELEAELEQQITIRFGDVDGPYGTLAHSELATHSHSTPKQVYDTREPWHMDPATEPELGRISLRATMVHELCHALGVTHGGLGLMAARYNPLIQRLQPGYDTEELVGLYGAPPFTRPQHHVECTVTVDGIEYQGALSDGL